MADKDTKSDLVRTELLTGNVQTTRVSDLSHAIRAFPKFTNDSGGALTATVTIDMYRVKPQLAILPGSKLWCDAITGASLSIGWKAYTGLRDNAIPADAAGLHASASIASAQAGVEFDKLNGRPVVIEGPALLTITVTGADVPTNWNAWLDLYLANVISGQ